MTGNPLLLVIVAGIMFAVLGGVTLLSHIYSLNGIKSKTVGDGQHGTARWATKAEIKKIYKHVPFDPQRWRKQAAKGQTPTGDDGKPLPQGIVVGCTGNTTAMVDTGDVHALMIGAAGVGKTAFWLYPCIEYACASGMSWLSTDTKGDVMRNYGHIAKQYGYNVSVIDLRNPTRSNGNNLLHLVNKYMDLYQQHPDTLVYKAKAEKYAKIISKTIILSGMDAASFGQNAYFYDAAEGLLTATILLVAEFCEPEKRHIVSVFKIIQELLAPSQKKGKNQFQQLMEMLHDDHKEGAEIIVDNTQLTIFGGFAPNSSSAEVLSKALGSRTVMSGSVSRSRNDPSESLQMIERPLLTPDELKSLPKGQFVVMKTGVHPMRVKLKLFFKWGIEFDEDNPYTVTDHGGREVQYAEKKEIMDGIIKKYHPDWIVKDKPATDGGNGISGQDQAGSESHEPQHTPPKKPGDKKGGGGTVIREKPSAKQTTPLPKPEVKPNEPS